MKQLKYLFLTWLSKGRENQSFLGAPWVARLLAIAPAKYQRSLALRLLAWSPHYFYRDIGNNRQLTYGQFLQAEYDRNRDTREKIREQILAPLLHPNTQALDYGCGPGFLAAAVARKIHSMQAIDISTGVLACAKTINHEANLHYRHTSEIDAIGAESLDLVYSFAVIQHVTDEVFSNILEHSFRCLKKNGKIAFHVVLEQADWRTQQQWESDTSLKGRVKLSYGLNCFSRSQSSVIAMVEAAGFANVSITPLAEIVSENFDDICTQHFLVASKLAA